MKRFLMLLLALALTTGSACASTAVDVQGYDKKRGFTYVTFGRYPQDASGAPAPILWRVLRVEDAAAWLISDRVLDAQPVQTDAVGFDGWETCALRAWLNDDFLNAAFACEDRPALVEDGAGDLVSLPEADLLKDASQGLGGERERTAAGTAYALARGLRSHGPSESPYWMRTRSTSDRRSQRLVIAKGKLGYMNVAARDIGVRPVIGVKLDTLQVLSGAGAMTDPFVLSASPEALERARLAREQAEAEARRQEEARQLARQQQEAAEKKALEDAARALADAEQALADAKAAGASADKLCQLEQRVGEKRQALNLLTMTEREGFPMLTAQGFLPEGEPEFILEDADNGLWRYASQDLLIEIRRHTIAGPVRYLAAELFVREGTPGFHMVPHDWDHMTTDAERYLEKPVNIARNNRLVFSTDGDYFLYRIDRKGSGVTIRRGEVLVDSPPSEKRDSYPPLDMLALYPDGDMRAFAARERTAQELLAGGAVDVLSFGPYLIRDGQINTSYVNYGTTLQPRVAIGMVEKGHYWCVIVEGRIRESRGMDCRQVAGLMADLGCGMAFNLDGGWTSAMVFMGKQLNQLDHNGVRDNARKQNEVMGIGVTDAYR